MPSAIGSPTYTRPPGLEKPTTGLEAQLARYQKELSNCVNCDTANTREGRETIQALSNKISQIKTRIEASTATKSSIRPTAPNATTSAEAAPSKKSPASEVQGSTVSATVISPSSETATAGRHVDVFA